MGCMRALFRIVGIIVGTVSVILFGPNPLPQNVKFTKFDVVPTKNFDKGMELNELLNNAERLFEDEIKGPESFAIVNGELFTTLHSGFVAKVFEDQIIPLVKFGKPCVGWWDEKECGRPLGLRAAGNDHLVVADAYYGIFKYNIKTGQTTTLIDKDIIIDGHNPKIFNSIDIAKDGTIYWSHSSSDFDIRDGIYTLLADGSGRLLKYDPITKTNTVLIKDLFFANGVVLSPEEDFILVVETGHSRIHRYFLKGPRKFTNEIFIDGLPGLPDNLRLNGEGGFYVSLYHDRNQNYPALFQSITPFPSLRTFLARILAYTDFFLNKVDQVYPSEIIKRSAHLIGHFESFIAFLPVNVTLLEVDINGKIIRNYHGSDGSFTRLSDVIIFNEYLYMGSPSNNYLGRIKLSKLKNKIPVVTMNPSISSTLKPQTTTTKPVIYTTPRPAPRSSTTKTTQKPSAPYTTTQTPTTYKTAPHGTTLIPPVTTTIKPTTSSPPPQPPQASPGSTKNSQTTTKF